IDFARENRRPAFLLVRTYRLNAHSKSDDDRDRTEVDWFTAQDPLNRLLASSDGWRNVREEIHARIHAHILAARPERLESPD
ncbi:thiamine pyrophosphate-dependent enzyme, partial [Vibrio parahaemolyticus]